MKLYDTDIVSRLMLGTAQYPSPGVLADAFRRSGAGIATVSVRREAGHEKAGRVFTYHPVISSGFRHPALGRSGPKEVSCAYTSSTRAIFPSA